MEELTYEDACTNCYKCSDRLDDSIERYFKSKKPDEMLRLYSEYNRALDIVHKVGRFMNRMNRNCLLPYYTYDRDHLLDEVVLIHERLEAARYYGLYNLFHSMCVPPTSDSFEVHSAEMDAVDAKLIYLFTCE
jgi:hypothetical protein|uniref:Uncharacterized protein n=1 Tax=viral metagenome TaxID=1070528 RepID=A0A6C0AGM4_9ZZZZ